MEYHLSELTHQDKLSSLHDIFLSSGVFDILLTYDADYKYAKVLREVIDTICKLSGIPPKWRTRIVLIYDELSNNAIEHGSTLWDSIFISLNIKVTPESYKVQWYVEDMWKGLQSKNAHEMMMLQQKYKDIDFSEYDSIRGRWLFLIISQLVGSLSFDDTVSWWLRVSFTKTIQREIQES